MDGDRHDILIVGAGNAGISLAARLRRDGAHDVAMVAAAETHRYRPLLNYVGAGQATMAELERPTAEVVPDGCTWIRDDVVAVDPDARTAHTAGGRTIRWTTLVLTPGLVEDWDATPGLREAFDAGWAVSTFLVGSAPQVWPALRDVRRGTVLFTVPPEPAPCGATALKPLFLACDHWRQEGVLDDLRVVLAVPGQQVTGLPRADERLEDLFDQYGVEVLRGARLTRVDADRRRVELEGPSSAVDDVTLAHLVPHYRAPTWVAEAGLADTSPAGLVDVDPETLRHRRHPSIWSQGDAARVATRPSGGALRKQTDVLAHNIKAVAIGGELQRYDGYTVMPITTGRHQLMLVEVDRQGRPSASAPLVDGTKPRRTAWAFDRYGLPHVYWRRILRGRV